MLRNENKFLQISIHKLTMDRDIFIFQKLRSANNSKWKLSRQVLIRTVDKFFFYANSMSKNSCHPYELLIGRLRFCLALYKGLSYLNSSP